MSISITSNNSLYNSKNNTNLPQVTSLNKSYSESSLSIDENTPSSTNSLSPASYQILLEKKISSLSHASKIAAKIGFFLQQNWKTLLLYIFIWTIIIVSYGAMYGFGTVGLPLCIGLGVGFGIGIISGIVVALKIDKTNKWAGKNTLWNLVTHYMWDLDEYGTRQILIATIITVVSAAFTASPYAIGAIIGLLLGNHILTKICYHLRDISTPLSLEQKQLLEKKKQKEIKLLENELKIELLIKNNLNIKKQLLSLKDKKNHNLEKKIYTYPRKYNRKKTYGKRIITVQNKKVSDLRSKMKCNASRIRLLSTQLLQLDNTINIALLESAFKI